MKLLNRLTSKTSYMVYFCSASSPLCIEVLKGNNNYGYLSVMLFVCKLLLAATLDLYECSLRQKTQGTREQRH